MWGNGYNLYGNFQQQDAQPNYWFNQNASSATNPFGLRFDNYLSGAANPFAGQVYSNIYQPYNNFGYQFK
ncbi:unnamed protein product [Adineta ricciae]|uniref:Uncharacterized protein n=1 Tax=Adineta ricciae TaxID=249248 RepID=A0A814Z7U0_ADIRI|nr:unnamed protein product [Adineta ricciae]